MAPVPSQLISFSKLTAQDHSYLVNGNATYTQRIALACIILYPWLNYCLLGGYKTTECSNTEFRVNAAQRRPPRKTVYRPKPIGLSTGFNQDLCGYQVGHRPYQAQTCLVFINCMFGREHRTSPASGLG